MSGRRGKSLNIPNAESIANVIEGEIIFGKMSPGEDLVEDALIEQFGSKRHVIRSAIDELIARGIVEKERGRSAKVKSFTPTEVDELYHMRAVLHREAVRIMPLPAALADLRALGAIHADYAQAVDDDAPPLQIHRLNDRFHKALFALCRNSLLCEMIAALNLRSAPIRSHGMIRRTWLKQALKEHTQMIDALEQGDRQRLLQLTVDHMMPARQIWEDTHTNPALRIAAEND